MKGHEMGHGTNKTWEQNNRVMLKDNSKQRYPSKAIILTVSIRGLGLLEHCNHKGLLWNPMGLKSQD